MRIWLLIVIVFLLANVFSQDIHFTQFQSAPYALNPASTGYFKGNYRFGGIYRAQWPFAAQGKFVTYQNYSAFVDFSLLENRINKLDFIGIGAYALRDEAGDGRLSTTKASLQFAYHKGFDKKGKYRLSAGIGVMYVNKQIDFEKLYFNNQWNGTGFDNGLPNLESYLNTRVQNIDLNAGLQFAMGIGKGNSITIGYAMHHLNRPKESFYQADNRVGLRYTGTVNANILFGRELEWQLGAFVSSQKRSLEAAVSALAKYTPVKYKKRDEYSLYFGMYYRTRDAIAPMLGFMVYRTRLLISYDITVSRLNPYNTGVGALEISLVHTGAFPQKNNPKKVYCPLF